MGKEIERKFLLKSNAWRSTVSTSCRMRQNYLAHRPTVRVRLAGERGFLTIKGETRGCSRTEYEYPVPAADAAEMLDTLCAGYEVAKTRHIVEYAGKRWEIDVFEGLNAGLEMAEIELAAPDEVFELPPWAGEEVTGRAEYYNGSLAKVPWSMRKKTGETEHDR